jgi:hypothetical protein
MTLIFQAPDVTSVVAWIGALTGIAALLWQVATWRRSAHNVKVSYTQSWVAYSNGNLSEALVCVSARNIGAAAVTVTQWGISMGSNGENLTVLSPIPNSTPLPHRLESGSEMSLFLRAVDLLNTRDERRVPLQQMRGWVGLATGKKVYGKSGVPVSEI